MITYALSGELPRKASGCNSRGTHGRFGQVVPINARMAVSMGMAFGMAIRMAVGMTVMTVGMTVYPVRRDNH